MKSVSLLQCQRSGIRFSACRGRSSSRIEAKQQVSPRIQQNHKTSKNNLDVDLEKLYTDATYVPPPQHGSVKIFNTPGKGRGLVASADVAPGQLLLVSAPVWMLRAPEGMNLRPEDLHRALSSQQLPAADRYRLGLLYDGSAASAKRAADFKDFREAEDRCRHEEKKAAKKVKGFGASSSSSSSKPGGAELEDAVLQKIVGFNSYGSEHMDFGASACRGEAGQAFIGLWPEMALLNHSCVPNALCMVVGDRMFVRATTYIPAGGEVSTSYLGLLGATPVADRRKYLGQAYGFECNCPRCKAEASTPQEVQQMLQSIHEMLAVGGSGDGGSCMIEAAKKALAADDSAAVEAMRKQLQERVDALEALFSKHALPEDLRPWLRASVYGAYELLVVCNDDEKRSDEALPSRLVPLMEVVGPCSDAHLFLTVEWLVRVGEARGGNKEHPDVGVAAKACLQAHLRRYGMVSDDMLTRLMQARTRVESYMGRYNIGSRNNLGFAKQPSAV